MMAAVGWGRPYPTAGVVGDEDKRHGGRTPLGPGVGLVMPLIALAYAALDCSTSSWARNLAALTSAKNKIRFEFTNEVHITLSKSRAGSIISRALERTGCYRPS